MNTHGRHAMDTMKNHDPKSFSEIEDPETYFSNLGVQIQEQIWTVTEALLPQREEGQTPMEFIGLSNMAKVRARGKVYQEMIYDLLPPEEDDSEDSTPLPEERFS